MEKEGKKTNNCVCAVAVCPSPKSATTYHRFPQDSESRKKWVQACKRNDGLLNPLTALVCSNHFRPSDYERDLKNELLGLPLRNRLKKEAVPSLKLNYGEDKKPSEAQIHRALLKEKLERKALVDDLLRSAAESSQTALVCTRHCHNE